ncbi:GAF and ANTAR domain-containing protein [Spirillospora sp. CA-253888]
MDSYERAWRHANEHAAGRPLTVEMVLSVAAQAVDADGFGMTLVSGPGLRELAAASGRVATLIEETQLTSGEGPCSDAYSRLAPVLVPDLNAAADRWPGFVPAMAPTGVAAVFAFPLQTFGIRVGALDLYRYRPGPLSKAQFTDATAFADVTAQVAFCHHAALRALPPLGDDEPPHGFPPGVHQAAGVLAAQLAMPVTDALLRLRAYAYLHDEPLTAIAGRVVERRLTLAPHHDPDR